MPSQRVDGNDLLVVYEATRQAVERARASGGPSLIESVTYRWRGHSKSDRQLYRSKEEVEAWKAKDPIRRFREHLIAQGMLSEEEAERLNAEAKAAIEEAVRFAEESEEPPLAEILSGVYA